VADKKTQRIRVVHEISVNAPFPTRPTQIADDRASLIENLSDKDLDILSLRPSDVRKLARLTGASSDNDILDAIAELQSPQNLILSVLLALRDDGPEAAALLLHMSVGTAVALDQDPTVLSAALSSGINADEVVDIRDLTQDEFDRVLEAVDFRDWLLFLHPDQSKLANATFIGPTFLTGISGSGKTSILIHRAKALAERYPNDRILIVAMNPALSAFLGHLCDVICGPAVRHRILCRSIQEVCRELLKEFRPDNRFQVEDPRSRENLEDNWHESYSREEQQECLLPIITSLERRNIDASRYIRDELIWLRSGFSIKAGTWSTPSRELYLDPDKTRRVGREIPFPREWREHILRALEFYEEWLAAGDFADETALSLTAHTLVPRLLKEDHSFVFRSVLIDEVQDVGTLEIELLSSLVREHTDGLFFVGDRSQQVFPKLSSIADAGVEILNRKYFRKNYRNTQEILSVATRVLESHANSDEGKQEGMIVSQPESSMRTGPVPLAVHCTSLQQEIAFIRYYITERRRTHPGPICIVACGVRDDADTLLNNLFDTYLNAGLPVTLLSKNQSVPTDAILISPLETVKGFEFSLVIVSQCTNQYMPNPALPVEESWRDARRLYVAITRARDELVFTYAHEPSRFIEQMLDLVKYTSAEQEFPDITECKPRVLISQLNQSRTVPKDFSRCHHCDALAIPGDNVCFSCFSGM
jgi:superfamily I DNA/RNA helicase